MEALSGKCQKMDLILISMILNILFIRYYFVTVQCKGKVGDSLIIKQSGCVNSMCFFEIHVITFGK